MFLYLNELFTTDPWILPLIILLKMKLRLCRGMKKADFIISTLKTVEVIIRRMSSEYAVITVSILLRTAPEPSYPTFV